MLFDAFFDVVRCCSTLFDNVRGRSTFSVVQRAYLDGNKAGKGVKWLFKYLNHTEEFSLSTIFSH